MLRNYDKIAEDIMMHIKPIRQIPSYCGPTVIKMAFQYWKIRTSIKRIAKIAGTTKEHGTSIEGMIKAAEDYAQLQRFEVFAKKRGTINDLRYYINKKIPVIVDWFSVDEGHYSIVVGIDRKNIILRDPSFSKIRKMPIKRFLGVWFDFPGDYPKRKKDFILRFMMVMVPKEAKPEA